jgi:hypothetical protein
MLVKHLVLDNIFERSVIIGRKVFSTERNCTVTGQGNDFVNAVFTINEVFCFYEIMISWFLVAITWMMSRSLLALFPGRLVPDLGRHWD